MAVPYQYGKQFRTVFLLELLIFFLFVSLALFFLYTVCSDGLVACFAQEFFSLKKFIFLSVIRPLFIVAPQLFLSYFAFLNFTPQECIVVVLLGNLTSTLLVYIASSLVGGFIIKPWFVSNLPKTQKMFLDNDWKIILLLELVCFFYL